MVKLSDLSVSDLKNLLLNRIELIESDSRQLARIYYRLKDLWLESEEFCVKSGTPYN